VTRCPYCGAAGQCLIDTLQELLTTSEVYLINDDRRVSADARTAARRDYREASEEARKLLKAHR